MKLVRSLQRGFSLIELMVGVALTMVIAVAMLTLLADVSRNNTELARTNSVIENGRFALQLLESDISAGGFWGGFVPTYDDITVSSATASNGTATVAFPTVVSAAPVPDPCPFTTSTDSWDQPAAWTTDYKAQLIAIPVQVYSLTSTTTSSPVCLGSSTKAGPLRSHLQANTDILVVRHAAPCVAVTASSATDEDCKNTANNLFFQFSRCANDTTASWLLATSGLTLNKGNCTTTADTYRFVSTIYWVRDYFTAIGDGIPTLMRTRYSLSGSTLAHQDTQVLVDGIQAFRVQLGVDNYTKPTSTGGTCPTNCNQLTASSFTAAPAFASTSNTYTPTNRGDGNADKYIVCANPGSANDVCYDATSAATLQQSAFNLANTVSVKLFVLARAQTTTPGYTDSKVYCLSGACTLTSANQKTCGGSGSNDYLTIYGPYCDGYKRHVYTQTVRMNNISMRREVPSSW